MIVLEQDTAFGVKGESNDRTNWFLLAMREARYHSDYDPIKNVTLFEFAHRNVICTERKEGVVVETEY